MHRRFWNWVKNEDGVRTLRLDGAIAEESWLGDEVTPQQFKSELHSGEGDITVWINSPGGDVFAAAQIYNMLMEYKGKVTVKIDGIAASAASVIAMAGGEVYMSPVSMLMIHNPATVAIGDSAEMAKAIAMLDEVKESIINAYELKSGLSRARISHLMDAETWLNAKKAVEFKFADGILFARAEPPGAEAILTFKAPNQDGAFYISGTLDMRNITLEGTIVAGSADEAVALRQRLLCIFSPKKAGVLTYRGKRIPCTVEEVAFAQRSSARTPSFFISLLCPSPFFEDIDELRMELAAWTAKFRFALEIPETGMEFGAREPSQIIFVDNDGDVPCGCSIQFRALGSVTNPELMNVDTGEVMRILRTMTPGQQITVDGRDHILTQKRHRDQNSTEGWYMKPPIRATIRPRQNSRSAFGGSLS